MFKENEEWLKEIKKYVEASFYEEAVACFFCHIEDVFSSPDLKSVYDTIIKIPKAYFETTDVRLMYGWLCFANGNNQVLRWVLTSLDLNTLSNTSTKANYLALNSMALFSSEPEKSLDLSKQALTYFSLDDTSTIKANVYMTYGRQLATLRHYRLSAENFNIAGRLFEKNQCEFLAISCFVNEALNRYALGNYTEVIKACTNHLRMTSSGEAAADSPWHLLKLPLAMSYYELNKRSLALKALKEVEKTIEMMKLPHMHGLLEQYFFKLYLVEQEYEKMEDIIRSLETIFQHMDYLMIKQLILSMKVEKCLLKNETISKEWIETLDLSIMSLKDNVPFFILESLLKLKLEKIIKGPTLETLDVYFNKIRHEAHQANTQSLALYLSELYYKEGQKAKALHYLKIAYDIYADTGTLINFFNRNISFNDLVKKIDVDLANEIETQNPFVHASFNKVLIEPLTKREIEILKIMSKGKSNKAIAEALFITQGTVKWHLINIYSKLDVNNRVEALEKAKAYQIL